MRDIEVRACAQSLSDYCASLLLRLDIVVNTFEDTDAAWEYGATSPTNGCYGQVATSDYLLKEPDPQCDTGLEDDDLIHVFATQLIRMHAKLSLLLGKPKPTDHHYYKGT